MPTEPAKTGNFNVKDWISKSEAARLRGVSRQAIWELVRRGRLKSFRFGGRMYLSRTEVMGFERRARGPSSEAYIMEEVVRLKKKKIDPTKWISLVGAAHDLGVTRQVVGDLIRRRRFRTMTIGSKMLIQRSGLEKFKQQQGWKKPKRKRAKKK
jgi:excisionase family DNA binding protein